MTRPHIVQSLVDAANTGMASVAHGTTADEVYSAQMTMAHIAVKVAVEAGAKKADLRRILGSMMLMCAEDTVQ